MENDEEEFGSAVEELKRVASEEDLPDEAKGVLDCKSIKAVIQLRNENGPRFGEQGTSFWSGHPENAAYSNFRGPLSMWGKDFKSPQRLMGYVRNRVLGQKADADRCLNLRDNEQYEVKYLSDKSEAKLSRTAWMLLTGELLTQANLQKFTQTPTLRERLLDSTGPVWETNTASLVFSAGLDYEDPLLLRSDKWPSPHLNVAGSIIEYVRREIGRENQLYDETMTHSLPRSRASTSESIYRSASDGSVVRRKRSFIGGGEGASPPGSKSKNT